MNACDATTTTTVTAAAEMLRKLKKLTFETPVVKIRLEMDKFIQSAAVAVRQHTYIRTYI